MSDNLYVSTAGAVTRLRQLEILANNLANADTVGFKSDAPVFRSSLEAALRGPDGHTAPGPGLASYVATDAVQTDFARGPATETGRALDAAIDGPGFFVVETPAGVRYTRAGSFVVNREGWLATAQGHPVLGDGGPIQATGRALRIREDGSLVDPAGQPAGRLRIEEFDTPQALTKEGANLFRAPASAVGLPVEHPKLLPGSVEQSNVQSVGELARLMILQRAFEASMQALRADDQATNRLIQEISQ